MKKKKQSIKTIIKEIGNELQTNKHQHRSLYSIFLMYQKKNKNKTTLNWNYVVEVAHWYILYKRIRCICIKTSSKHIKLEYQNPYLNNVNIKFFLSYCRHGKSTLNGHQHHHHQHHHQHQHQHQQHSSSKHHGGQPPQHHVHSLTTTTIAATKHQRDRHGKDRK